MIEANNLKELCENAKEKTKEKNLVKARTAVMNGYVKTFVELYPVCKNSHLLWNT